VNIIVFLMHASINNSAMYTKTKE